MLFFLLFSSANPSRLFFCLVMMQLWRLFLGCFAVPWMQRELVWHDWAVGDWVWNGAGQPQGIWTGLMDLFETCRGYEQWGSLWGHVYSEPSRACHMPIHFLYNLSKCSAASGCHWAQSLGGNLLILPGKLKKSLHFQKGKVCLFQSTMGFLVRTTLCAAYHQISPVLLKVTYL